MEEDSYDLAMDWDSLTCRVRTSHTNHKDELSYPEADAEVDVDKTSYVTQWPVGKSLQISLINEYGHVILQNSEDNDCECHGNQ